MHLTIGMSIIAYQKCKIVQRHLASNHSVYNALIIMARSYSTACCIFITVVFCYILILQIEQISFGIPQHDHNTGLFIKQFSEMDYNTLLELSHSPSAIKSIHDNTKSILNINKILKYHNTTVQKIFYNRVPKCGSRMVRDIINQLSKQKYFQYGHFMEFARFQAQ